MGGSTQVYHDPAYLTEVWALFGVGVAIFTVRFIVRLRTVGLRGFQGDDYMALVVLACYTADAITVTITYLEGSNVDYTAAKLAQLDDVQIKRIVFGSRMQLLAWYTYTALMFVIHWPNARTVTDNRRRWGLKACMLFFYNRLTFGLRQHKLVKFLGIACFATYVMVFLTITCSCHPIHLNWQVRPLPPEQCVVRRQNFYVTTVLNVLTDAAILSVPIPLMWKLRVPLKKKITLGILLSSGIFVITAAVVRIVMTLKAHPSALTINKWGVRETIAGIVACNAPILKPRTASPAAKLQISC